MVTGYGIIGLIVMCMSMDIGQDQDRDVLMKQVIGKADHAVNTGSKAAGTNKRKHKLSASELHFLIVTSIYGLIQESFEYLNMFAYSIL